MSDEDHESAPAPPSVRRLTLSRLQHIVIANAIAEHGRAIRRAQAALDSALVAAVEDNTGAPVADSIGIRPVVEHGELVALDLIERE